MLGEFHLTVSFEPREARCHLEPLLVPHFPATKYSAPGQSDQGLGDHLHHLTRLLNKIVTLGRLNTVFCNYDVIASHDDSYDTLFD